MRQTFPQGKNRRRKDARDHKKIEPVMNEPKPRIIDHPTLYQQAEGEVREEEEEGDEEQDGKFEVRGLRFEVREDGAACFFSQ